MHICRDRWVWGARRNTPDGRAPPRHTLVCALDSSRWWMDVNDSLLLARSLRDVGLLQPTPSLFLSRGVH